MLKNPIRTAIAVFLVILLGVGFTAVALAPTSHGRAGVLKILLLGDSITAGTNGYSYGHEIDLLLDSSGIPHQVVTAGYPGWKCSDLSPIARAKVREVSPDVTVLSCGTNDAANGIDPTNFRVVYCSLYTEVMYAGVGRLLPSLIQYSARSTTGTPNIPWWLPGEEAKANDVLNAVNTWFPFGTRSLNQVDFSRIPESLLSSDFLHPSHGGYKAMANLVYRALWADPIFRSEWNLPEIPETCGLSGRKPGAVLTAPFRECNHE